MVLGLFGIGSVLALVSLVAHLVVVVAAFRAEVWKGVVSLLVWPYWLYYAFKEYRSPGKTAVLATALICGLAAAGMLVLGILIIAAMTVTSSPA